MFILIFIFSIFACYSAEESSFFDLTNFHGLPSAIIGGHVNVITGDFIDYEMDAVLPGPEPFPLERVYTSSDKEDSFFGTGWRSNHTYSGYFAMQPLSYNQDYMQTPKTAKNFFIVADGLGAKMTYLGLHGEPKLAGGYRVDQKLWTKGMTNVSGNGISGKTNVKNSEARIDPEKGTLRYGNGDTIHFVAGDSTEFETRYKVTKKQKLNRLSETYSFCGQHIKDVKFRGLAGAELGYYQISHSHKDYNKEVFIETPIGNVRYLYADRNRLTKVERPNAPPIEYRYEKNHNSFISSKNLPDNRYLDVEYYHSGNHKVKHYPGDRPAGIVKKIFRPLSETNSRIKEYEFIYHYEKSGRDDLFQGRTDVIDALGNTESYYFEKSRLTSIVNPQRTEEFLWGRGQDEGHFIGKRLLDKTGAVCLETFMEYDAFGNVTKEGLKGNLTGNNTLDRFSKKMAYSSDGNNLPLEERDNKKKLLYRYHEGTNLVAAKLLKDLRKITQREFFFYDDNGFMIKEIIDDGSQESWDDLTGVSERLIKEYVARTSFPFGLAEEVILKAYDSGIEKPLKRFKNSYTPEGWLSQIDLYDANNQYVHSKKFRYNRSGKVIYEEDPIGAITEYAYDLNNNCIEQKGPLSGYRKIFKYDLSNRLVSEKEIYHETTLAKSFRYNYKGECIEETDISGNRTKHTYDELGRKISTEGPSFFTENGTFSTLKTSTEYDCLNNPTVQTDARGHATTTKFTAYGKPYSIKYPDNTSETMIYDTDGTLKESVDKYGNKTIILSDYLNRPLIKETYAPSGELLKKTTYTYNAFHLIKETDALGCETNYTYDFAGRLIRKTRGTSLEDYAYDSLSRLYKTTTWTSETDAVIVTHQFDNNDRVIQETTHSLSGLLQACVQYEYNALGKKTKEIRQDAITHYIYNPRGDLIQTINPLGVSTWIQYDFQVLDARGERGTRVISIDPKGVMTIIDKNALGLEKRGEKKNSLGETLQLWDNLYTDKGEKSKRIEVVYINGEQQRHVITSWKWDSLGRLESLTEAYSSPDEKTTTITYNRYGQRKAITKPSGRRNYFAYDTLGRMSRWFSSDHSFDYHYTYDALDHPVLVEDKLHKTSTIKTYNSQGLLSCEQQSNGLTVQYDYDISGRTSRFIYPDGSSTSYDYIGARLHTIKRGSYYFEALEYDLRGKLQRAKLPLNAGTIEISHDLMGRTTSVTAPFLTESLTNYDFAGNLLNRTLEDPSGTLHETFAYDDLNQLTQENDSQYRYDSLYNRIKENNTDNTVNALNQILERKDRSYQYDADGNLILLQKPDKTLHFTYDAAGRMTSATDGSTTATYRYDETNRRVAKTVNNIETRFIYNGQCELGTHDHGGELRILGGLGLGAEIGDAIAIEKNDSILSPIHDHNGNLIALIDAKTGTLTHHTRYTAFGESFQDSPISWGFSSKRKDAETGLIFFGRRYYDPESGRFITKDPLGDRDGPNLYAYVSNNPLIFIDLFGLICERCGGEDHPSYSPMRWIRSGVEYVGSCIESFSRHCIPPSPVQYAVEGIGLVLQGRDFFHKDNYAHPVFNGRIYGKELEGCSLVSTLGIQTFDGQNQRFGTSISKAMDGSEVFVISHRTTGLSNDLFNCLHLLLGVQTDATRALAATIEQEYNKWIERGVTDPIIAVWAHSRGGLETYMALKLLPAEIKSCVIAYTFGSAYQIPADGLRDAVNYVNSNDLIPKIASLYCSGNGAKIIYTDYCSDGIFNFIDDHGIDTPGYVQAVQDSFKDLQRKLSERSR